MKGNHALFAQIRQRDDELTRLRAALAAAEAKLTAASKAAIDMMNRHRDVVLSLEAKLADYEGTDGRCPAGHNKRFTYDLSDLGGKVGCVACERDELAAKLADAEKHADELAAVATKIANARAAIATTKLMMLTLTDADKYRNGKLWGLDPHEMTAMVMMLNYATDFDHALAAHAARRAARDGQEGTR